jgi:hypothetical protein
MERVEHGRGPLRRHEQEEAVGVLGRSDPGAGEVEVKPGRGPAASTPRKIGAGSATPLVSRK